jgi:hypothetical protein
MARERKWGSIKADSMTRFEAKLEYHDDDLRQQGFQLRSLSADVRELQELTAAMLEAQRKHYKESPSSDDGGRHG